MSKIDITGVDLVKFVQKVYDLSVPQGLGMLHFVPGSLSLEEAKSLINDKPDIYGCVVNMDYVRGRACKMNVWKEGDKFLINDSWYDHTDTQLWELLNSVGIEQIPTVRDHGVACNCSDCRAVRNKS